MSRDRILAAVLLAVAAPVLIAGGCTLAWPWAAEPTAEERAGAVLEALKNQDIVKLAELVHPDKGVRFSPYPYVNVASDLVFSPEELPPAFESEQVYTWGRWDGSGAPMELTFAAYFQRFVFDHDYTQAEKVGVNEFYGQGNALNNAFEIYPQATIIEYYFSGFDPQYAGMDWRCLRLVLEQSQGHWFLIGVIHGEWTI